MHDVRPMGCMFKYIIEKIIAMNILNKFIVNQAEKIKKREESKKLSYDELKEKEFEFWRNIRASAKEQIITGIKDFAKTIKKPNIYEGLPMILNIYNLRYNGHNGWDGGPSSIMQCLKPEDKNKVIWITVKKLSLSWSYTDEMIDRFLLNEDEKLVTYTKNNSTYTAFTNWYMVNVEYQKQTLGLYWEIHFDTNIEFKPTWGLNYKSFLPTGSQEALETERIWKEEISIALERNKLDERQKALAIRKLEIHTKYENISRRC